MPRFALLIAIILGLLPGCSSTKRTSAKPSETVAAAATPAPTASAHKGSQEGAETLSPLKERIKFLAEREWEFFGRQNVIFEENNESIPHVGHWEDDNEEYAFRVNWYWRVVDKPELNGNNCSKPWSAAFVSWIMQNAGVPAEVFPPADAHWIYLKYIMSQAEFPGAAFIPHGTREYQPKPGDLVCASRADTFIPENGGGLVNSEFLDHGKLHCDIVVERRHGTLEVIGGNVRNSVSRSILKLDKNGFLEPNRRRPWFIVVENRL